MTGPPAQIISGVRQSSWSLRQFSLSEDGLLVYAPGSKRSLQRQLVWVDRSGGVEAAAGLQAEFLSPRLSLDGRRLAVQIVGANDTVWVYEFARQAWTRLNPNWDSVSPVWAPDGARLAVGVLQTRSAESVLDGHRFARDRARVRRTTQRPDANQLVARRPLPRVHGDRFHDAPRHLDHGRREAGAARVPANAVRRERRQVLPRRAVDRVRVDRVRPIGDLRAQRRRIRRTVADFE